jgi:beta-lactamase regulating signal transducer with metallopeptidase domain/Leucine-rich repeat (LRR) protein
MNWLMSVYPGDNLVSVAINTVLQIVVIVSVALAASRYRLRWQPAHRFLLWRGVLATVTIAPLIVAGLNAMDLCTLRFPLLPSAHSETDDRSSQSNPASVQIAEGGTSFGTHAPFTDERSGENSIGNGLPATTNRSSGIGGSRHPGTEPTTMQSNQRSTVAANSLESRLGETHRSTAQMGGLRAAIAIGTLIWTAGVILLSCRLVHGIYRIRQLRNTAYAAILTSAQRGIVEDVSKTLGIAPPVLASHAIDVPMAVGILHPIVMIPSAMLRDLTNEQFRQVLIHECGHLLQYDNGVALLARFASIIYWPHPSIHILNRNLSDAREDVCDNRVLATEAPTEYSKTLLTAAPRSTVRRTSLVAVGLFSHEQSLAERATNLLDDRRSRSVQIGFGSRLSLIATLIITSAMLTSVGLTSVGLTSSTSVSAGETEQKQEGNEAVARPTEVPPPVNRVVPPPTPDEAKAAFKNAGIRAEISDGFGVPPFNNEPAKDPQMSIYFSGTRVTDEFMPYLLAFPETTSLEFSASTKITDKTLEIIGKLPNLTSLRLASSSVTGEGLPHLAKCTKLKNLTLKSAKLRDSELLQLDRLANLKLTGLSIGGWKGSNRGVLKVAKLKSLQSLTLNVGQTDDRDGMGRTVRSLFQLENLSSLEIMGDDIRNHASIRDEDLALLGALPALREITLSSQLLTNEGLKRIGACQQLTRLSIWHAPVNDEGLRHLSGLNSLKSLALHGTKITGTGFDSFISPNLTQVSLFGNSVTDEGLEQIGRLARLQLLRIGPCFGWFKNDGKVPLAVTDQGMSHLAQLQSLNSLHLSTPQVTDIGMSFLKTCPLRALSLNALPITDAGLASWARDSSVRQFEFADCPNLSHEGIAALHAARKPIITVLDNGRQIGTLQGAFVKWVPPVRR